MADPTGTGGLAGGRVRRRASRPADDELAPTEGSAAAGGVVNVSFERAAVASPSRRGAIEAGRLSE